MRRPSPKEASTEAGEEVGEMVAAPLALWAALALLRSHGVAVLGADETSAL